MIRGNARHAQGGTLACRHQLRRLDRCRSGQSVTRGLGRWLAPVIGLGLAACGPIYLHDPAGETAATAAMQDFQAVRERGRVAGLVAGYKAQQAITVQTLRALQTDDTRTQLVALSAESWDTLIGATRAELAVTGGEIQAREDEKTIIGRQLQAALEQQAGLQTQTKDLLDAMNATAEAEARYVATQKLLSAGFRALVSGSPEDSAAAEAALRSILAENVPARSFRQEGGKLVEITGEVTVGNALGLDPRAIDALGSPPHGPDDLFRLVDAVASLRDLTGLQITDPGIAVTGRVAKMVEIGGAGPEAWWSGSSGEVKVGG